MLKKTILVLFLFPLFMQPSFSQEKKAKTIIIDPGHGGNDPGAGGLISTEAQLTLEISKKLGERITKEISNLNVLFTRTTDIIPGNSRNKNEGLRYRANFANESKADLFISIHCNSAGKAPGGWNEKRIVGYDEQVSYVGKKKKKVVKKVPIYETVYVTNHSKGTETFIWTAKENSHKEQLVADHAEFAAYEADSSMTVEPNDPVINALKLLYTRKYFMKSLKLAELVQQEFEKRGRVNRGVKQRNDIGIWVLHATGMPSILVEIGFISNKEEELYMNSEQGQEEIVTDIINAIKIYFNSLEVPKQNNNTSALWNEKFPDLLRLRANDSV